MWNTWRKAYLIHIDILVRLAVALEQDYKIRPYQQRAESLIAGMKASVPYHLTRSPGDYLQCVKTSSNPENLQPNIPINGLSLIYPLYTAARCTFISHADKHYIVNTLNWIGSHMGIGQATTLAHNIDSGGNNLQPMPNFNIPFPDMVQGHILVWAAMMLG